MLVWPLTTKQHLYGVGGMVVMRYLWYKALVDEAAHLVDGMGMTDD